MRKKHHKLKNHTTHSVHFLSPEFVYYHKGVGWYLAVSVAALAVLAIAIWQRMWLLIAVLVAGIFVFMQYSRKRPKSKKCQISQEGVKVDDKFLPLNKFKSFTIIYDKPHSHLFLETMKRISPSFWLHLKNKDLMRVRNFLLKILPEKANSESVIARINKLVKF